MTEPEEWTASTSGEKRLVSLDNRIELMAVSVGVGDTSVLSDPDDETPERPAGVEELPLVVLDLTGHLHVGGQCLPARTPYLVTSVALDELIGGLIEARDELDARYPHRERGAQK